MSDRAGGLAMVVIASLLYSTAGLFTRALHLDTWTILAWRAVFGTAFMLAWMAVRDGRDLPRSLALGWRDLALAVPIAFSGIFYIFALELTTVADVMVIYATLPFVTAAVAWAWTGERPERRLLIASLAALGGVAVMVAGGTGDGQRLLGMAATLAMNVLYALILVNARRGSRTADGVFTLGTALSGVIAFAMSPSPAVGGQNLALLAPFGLITIGLAMALYLAGARRMPAAEVGLISVIDVAAGPLLVWAVFGEQVGPATIVGGVVVVAAVVWHLLPDLRRLTRMA